MRRRGRQPSLGPDPIEARERIVRSFLERARRGGIRSVVMGKLARDLHMSPSTLYRHFPSKQELVIACVRRWADELAALDAIDPAPPPNGPSVDALLDWADAWAGAVSRYSTAWWGDLRRGPPEAWAIFEQEMRRHKARGADLLRPRLRDDVHAETALAVLGLLLDTLTDPDFSEDLGITRSEAVQTAMSVWMNGALEPHPRRKQERNAQRRFESIDGGRPNPSRATRSQTGRSSKQRSPTTPEEHSR